MLLVQQCLKTTKISVRKQNKNYANLTPNLQLDLLSVNSNHSCTEFNTNCEIVNRLETFVSELKQQARFTDSYGRKIVVIIMCYQ